MEAHKRWKLQSPLPAVDVVEHPWKAYTLANSICPSTFKNLALAGANGARPDKLLYLSLGCKSVESRYIKCS
jgi:hypothetical protein